MIEFVKGDLFESGCEALVNACNTVGVMGAGLALQFKKKYPFYYADYKQACENGFFFLPGHVRIYQMVSSHEPHYLISFATKGHWREKSHLVNIKRGLYRLCDRVKARNIKSVAVPALGAGLGGLSWDEVRPLMVAAFEQLPDVHFKIYEPLETPGQGEKG